MQPTIVVWYAELRQRRTNSPAQLAQVSIVDAEVVTYFVDHRPAYLLNDFRLGAADGADRLPVNGDLVG
jgi:hypothetical protein